MNTAFFALINTILITLGGIFMPLTTLYNKVKNGVVQVLALHGNHIISSGTGSIIDDGSIVLTCEHCIVAGTQIAIRDPVISNRFIAGNVIFADKYCDIALIKINQTVGTPIKLANSDQCAIGNGAFVVGYPMGINEQTLLSAYIASITSNYLRIDSSVNHGNSGGPLFNLSGEQIGVINAKHGSLSQFLMQVKNARPTAMINIGGIDPVKTIQVLIEEMQKNLNLGIGYAIPTASIKSLHELLKKCIPWLSESSFNWFNISRSNVSN